MSDLQYHFGDDELLMILMDTPTRWLVRHGRESSAVSTLRQALRKAHEFSSKGSFSGRIVKQPNDEMVVEAHQIHRLCQQLNFAS